MMIPQGDWIVVARKARDNQSRGVIQKAGLTEKQAKSWARDLRSRMDLKEWNCWAMHLKEY